MLSEGTQQMFKNLRRKLKAAKEAAHTANMRSFRMGIEEVTLVTAEFDAGTGTYLVLMPEKFKWDKVKQELHSIYDINPKSVFLEFQTPSDVDPIMDSLARIKLNLQRKERERNA